MKTIKAIFIAFMAFIISLVLSPTIIMLISALWLTFSALVQLFGTVFIFWVIWYIADNELTQITKEKEE